MESTGEVLDIVEAGSMSSGSGNNSLALRFRANPELIPEESDLANHLRSLKINMLQVEDFELEDFDAVGNYTEKNKVHGPRYLAQLMECKQSLKEENNLKSVQKMYNGRKKSL